MAKRDPLARLRALVEKAEGPQAPPPVPPISLASFVEHQNDVYSNGTTGETIGDATAFAKWGGMHGRVVVIELTTPANPLEPNIS